MSDNNPVDPWSNLASELGAEPAPPAATPVQPPTPPSEPRRRRMESASSSQPASDWGSLASELGITPPPEPEVSSSAVASAAAPSATSKPVFRDSVRERLAQGGGRPSSEDTQSGYADSEAPTGRSDSRGSGHGGEGRSREGRGESRGRGREGHGQRHGGEGRGRGGRRRGAERGSEGRGRDRGRGTDRGDEGTRRERPPRRHEDDRGPTTEPGARETTSSSAWDDEPWDIEVVESSREIVESGFADEPGELIDSELPRRQDVHAEPGSEGGERIGRRRRRRRGGRGRERGGQSSARRGDQSTSAQHDEFASPYGEFELDESSAGADLRGEFDVEFDDVASEVETSSSVDAERRESPGGEGAEESRGRRRRRGRRRGRGRKSEEVVDKPRASEERECDESDDLDEVVEYGRTPSGAEPERTAAGGDDGGFGDELEDDGELVARPTHRGIPSWQETIDVMIANNMEARARNPRGSEGGRGRGGGRSGRGGRGGGRGRSSGG